MATLHSVGDILLQLLNEVLLFVPKLISAAILLLIGYIIARIVRTVLTRVLRLLRFDQVCDRAGITGMLQRAGSRLDGAGLLGLVVFWWIFLIFIENAFNALDLPAVTAFINSVLGYLPNVFVAILIVVIGALLANVAAGAVRGSLGEAGFGNAGVLATLVRWVILLFAFLAALTQLNVAPNMIFILFGATVAMLALAGGLAFGLGGREVAGQIVSSWYNRQSSWQVGQGTPGGGGRRLASPAPGAYGTASRATYTADPTGQDKSGGRSDITTAQ